MKSCIGNRRFRTTRGAVAGTFLVLALLSVAVAAQDPTLRTRPRDQVDREYLEAHRITMNVQVTDGSGKPVPDLDAADFTLFDNNQPTKIGTLRLIDGEAMNDATEVLIVLDAVNSTGQELQQERDAIFGYLAHKRGPLPYPTGFALWFNGQMKAVQSTTDRNALGRAFVSLTKGIHSNACSPGDGSVKEASVKPGPGALKAVAAGGSGDDFAKCQRVHFRDSLAALDGLAQQQRTIGGRTILIWMGPGWPLSGIQVSHLSAATRSALFGNVVGLTHDFSDAQVTIDALAPQDAEGKNAASPFDMSAPIAGAYSAQDADPAKLALPALAEQTGGRVLTTSRDLGADLVSCIHDADSYYAVTFQQMHTTSHHEFHHVEIKVNRPGLDLRTMTSYYAEP